MRARPSNGEAYATHHTSAKHLQALTEETRPSSWMAWDVPCTRGCCHLGSLYLRR